MRLGSASVVAVSLVAALACGCGSIGPRTISGDQFDYNRAVADSWKEQMLLNMVRLRYGEAPVFLDVSTIIAQYLVEGQAGVAGPGWDRPAAAGPPIASGNARWAERPTITYLPRTGEAFTRSLLRRIPVRSVVQLMQSGWSMETAFQTAIRSFNRVPALARDDPGRWNPMYFRAMDLLVRLSAAGAIAVQTRGEANEPRLVLLLDDREAITPVRAAGAELRQILGLDAEVGEVRITGGLPGADTNLLSIRTSSMLEILMLMSRHFDVPREHVEAGWASPPLPPPPGRDGAEDHPPIRVRCGDDPPEQAFVAVRERDTWFWIDEGDYRSKQTFSFLMVLLRLAESGDENLGPTLTINAGG